MLLCLPYMATNTSLATAALTLTNVTPAEHAALDRSAKLNGK